MYITVGVATQEVGVVAERDLGVRNQITADLAARARYGAERFPVQATAQAAPGSIQDAHLPKPPLPFGVCVVTPLKDHLHRQAAGEWLLGHACEGVVGGPLAPRVVGQSRRVEAVCGPCRHLRESEVARHSADERGSVTEPDPQRGGQRGLIHAS